MTWYYESGGQQQGPVSDSDIDRLLSEGKISLDTLVWREGQAGWAPLRAARPAGGAAPIVPPAPTVTGHDDIGLEVTRPGVPAAASPAPGVGSDFPQPGYIRCTATGRYFPPSEIINIQGIPYSSGAKPQVVASLQSGGQLPISTDYTSRTGPAWEQRETLGTWKAIVETIKGVLLNPTTTFATMKREGGLAGPIFFFLLTGGVGMAVNQIYDLLFQGAMLGALSSMGGRSQLSSSAMGLGMSAGVRVVLIIFMPLIAIVANFIYGGLAHLCLKLLKGANHPFETTMRTLFYTSGAGGILNLVPLCGGMVGALWSIVAFCIGLGKAHDTTTGKGVGGALLPMAFCCFIYVGIIAVVFGIIGATAGARGGQ